MSCTDDISSYYLLRGSLAWLNIVLGISKVFVMFDGMVKFCYIAGGKDSLVVIT